MTDCREALAHELAEQKRTIMEMPAGPALDAEVQAAVFGSTIYHGHNFQRIVVLGPHALEAELIPPYSTSPGAAWLVVERFPVLCLDRNLRVAPHYMVRIRHAGAWYRAEAEDFPLAICRAALLATIEARRP